MGVYDFPRQGATYNSGPSVKKDNCRWDPWATFGFPPSLRDGLTCVGYAPSQRRKCRNPIAKANRAVAENILLNIAQEKPNAGRLFEDLYELAERTLCIRNHQNQVDAVVTQWQTLIESMHPPRSHSSKSHKGPEPQVNKQSSQGRKERSHDGKVDKEASKYHEKRAGKFRNKEQHRHTRQFKEETSDESDFPSDSSDANNDSSDETDENSSSDESERSEQKHQPTPEEETKESESEKREKAEEQKARDAADQKSQEKARREKEREERERQARNKRTQEEARKSREERERLAKRKAEEERKHWDMVWQCYLDSWRRSTDGGFNLSEAGTEPTLREHSPTGCSVRWPVRSGARRDLKASTVEEFFRCGPAITHPSAQARFKLFQSECLKWHPDKIATLFRGTAPNAADYEIVTMIMRVVLKLRQEARDQRVSEKEK